MLFIKEEQMIFNNIDKWIMHHYAFYRLNTGGWQDSRSNFVFLVGSLIRGVDAWAVGRVLYGVALAACENA
jgi:hypothetical protein